MVYFPSLALIKMSICVTLLRIATMRPHRLAIFATMGITVSVALVGFIGDLVICRPISDQWTAGADGGNCAPRTTFVALNYTISIGAIVTDWACAIIPACIIWNAQMRRNVKLSVGIVLGLGSLASISTFARLPYLKYYGGNIDFLCMYTPTPIHACIRLRTVANWLFTITDNVGFVILWSVFEGGIGLVAGSLPMLRRFFRQWIGTEARSTNVGVSYATKGGGTTRKPSINSSINRVYHSCRGSRGHDERDWERLHDNGAGAHMLHGVPEDSELPQELHPIDKEAYKV